MSNIRYTGKDQNHQEETTIYWFDRDGEAFGVAESVGRPVLLDCDGVPIVDNYNSIHEFVVTDKMRNDY